MHEPRRLLLEAYQAALDAVNGRAVVHRWLQDNPVAGSVSVIAVGKAACAMARGAYEGLGDRVANALVVTRRGNVEDSLPWPVHEAGHPVPDADTLAAGEALEAFIATLPANANVLVLLSGGASALLEQLPAGMTLADLQRVNEWLLGSGLDIHAMNAIRKRLSRIKGGRLAQRLFPRPVLCLAISDVSGDDPRAIGSGPLTAESGMLDEQPLPEFVRALLGSASPLPAAEAPCFRNVRYHIIADNAAARRAAAAVIERHGFRAAVHAGLISGDTATTGAQLGQAVLESSAGVVQVWGGETTVVLPAHPGRGGRCQSLALAAAREFAGRDDCYLLAAGTDGSDGPGEDAGALVDGGTLARAATEGFDAGTALAGADAGRFLAASGDLIQTGPTGTNVMDLVLGLRT